MVMWSINMEGYSKADISDNLRTARPNTARCPLTLHTHPQNMLDRGLPQSS